MESFIILFFSLERAIALAICIIYYAYIHHALFAESGEAMALLVPTAL